jgi:hypothetical protein
MTAVAVAEAGALEATATGHRPIEALASLERQRATAR